MSHSHTTAAHVPATPAQRSRLLRVALGYHQRRAEPGATEWAVMVRAVQEVRAILEARQERQERRQRDHRHLVSQGRHLRMVHSAA